MSEEKVWITRAVLDELYRVMEANKAAFDKEVKAHSLTKQRLEMALESWKEEVDELKEEMAVLKRGQEEEVESWVCPCCCGYFHATKAEWDEHGACEKCR